MKKQNSCGGGWDKGRNLKLPLHILLILFSTLSPTFALPEVIRLGGLFDGSEQFQEVAFRHAVERVNADHTILSPSRLSAHWERVSSGDSFHASKKVCQQLNEGVATIIGPQSPQSASYVQSVCDAVEVPHIETTGDYRSSQGKFSINLFPHPSTLATAYAELFNAWGWENYVIIYQDNESLFRLQEILQASDPIKRQVKQLPSDGDYKPLFKSLRVQATVSNTIISNIIIDCDASKLSQIFQDAAEAGMMKDKRYFVTSLDLQTLTIEKFVQTEMNITAFRLVDPMNPVVQSIVGQWRNIRDYGFPNRNFTNHYNLEDSSNMYRNRGRQFTTPVGAEQIPELANDRLLTETALMYDAVELTARALHTLEMSQRQRIELKSLNCKKQNTWSDGPMVLEALRKTVFDGVTGTVELDPETGFRTDFQLDVLELTEKGLVKIGTWNSRPRPPDRFNWTRSVEDTQKQLEADLADKFFNITTLIDPPYCMRDEATGNFSGYVVDLVAELASHLKFNYKIVIPEDKQYGSLVKETGQWDGMIGDILSGRADIAVAGLTITHAREKVVDFTMPFMTLGISILYKKPLKDDASLFSFLKPFSPDVWIYMATAFLGVSLVLFVLARITPYDWIKAPPCSVTKDELENQFNLVNSLWLSFGSLVQQGCDLLPKITPYQWVNPHPCKDDPDELENDSGLPNSLWFSIGSLMQQGSDIAPKAASTRTVAGMWWFFTLIMISSYTANLAAFLTSEGLEEGITDAKDLPKQTKVKYGCVKKGSTANFFKDNTFPDYKEIWNNMYNMKPPTLIEKGGNTEGIKRVNNSGGTYAFFMESVSIEYITQQDCTLTQLGGLLDSKGYGIAFRKNSKYREAFNTKVLELSESGKLNDLKSNWWVGKCPATTTSSGGATPLGMANVGGVFVVLVGGCGVACIMGIVEFLWKARKLGRNPGESPWEEMMKELKFAVLCQGDKKPVKKSKPATENHSLEGSVPFLAFPRKEASEPIS